MDYVLAYNYRTHVSVKSALVSQGLAVISNGSSVNPEGKDQVQTEQSSQHEQGLVMEVASQDVLEDDRRSRREAFQRKLVEAGLEIESDEEVILRSCASHDDDDDDDKTQLPHYCNTSTREKKNLGDLLKQFNYYI